MIAIIPALPRRARGLLALACAVALCTGLAPDAHAASKGPRVFDSTETAASALIAAAETGGPKGLDTVVGASAMRWLRSGDAVADAASLAAFIDAYHQQHAIEPVGDNRATLVVGADRWPLPIPLVKVQSGWRFDPIAGREEMLARRVGRNELSTIEVLHAIVDAQREFATADQDGDGLLEYAGRFVSRPGKHDGLYWPTAEGEPPSPLGPLLAHAAAEGYRVRQGGGKAGATTPYHGYHFRMLDGQGPSARDGAYNYVVNGQRIGGFAVIAWPENYGNSGVMSFLVNHDGHVLQKDLGPQTAKLAGAMRSFAPDASWKPAEPALTQTKPDGG